MDTMQAMGSGTGVASGMGQLSSFGFEQPVIALCGDSTFYHAAIPALINARQHLSSFLLLILDNGATAMTGFQPHPGLGRTATGKKVPAVSLEKLCSAIGCPVETVDPYDLGKTTEAILRNLESPGLKVLILKQVCALVRAKQGSPPSIVKVNQQKCIGDSCGCSRFCTRVFKCPGLMWDSEAATARIDEAICTGCGVCVQICPENAIVSEEA
jgi:indolepyruvate ferredoxin oxidoreductase alpha subunit